MPTGTSAPGCPAVSCCDGTPLPTYYATWTNVGVPVPPFVEACDCIDSVVVQLDIYDYGAYVTNPNCPGCKTGEEWREWRGETTADGCFTGVGQLRFGVRMVCDPAGIGTGCNGYAVYVQITCGDPTAPAIDWLAMTALPAADSCTCTPFDILYSTSFTGVEASVDCCRDSLGDVHSGEWTLEITE